MGVRADTRVTPTLQKLKFKTNNQQQVHTRPKKKRTRTHTHPLMPLVNSIYRSVDQFRPAAGRVELDTTHGTRKLSSRTTKLQHVQRLILHLGFSRPSLHFCV